MMATLEDHDSLDSGGIAPTIAEAPLYEGQRLDQPTFHDLYCRMPDGFRAELIDGVVYLMNMPLSPDHAASDAGMIAFLYYYSLETPGTIVMSGATTKLNLENEVQPDSMLLIDPPSGGRTGRDSRGYLTGGPELVVEIGLSTIRLDLNAKKRAYEEAGALEYIVFDVTASKFHWFVREAGHFKPLIHAGDGLYRSRVFPGLWINEAAFATGDGQAVMAGLRRGLESPEHADFVERLRRNRANQP